MFEGIPKGILCLNVSSICMLVIGFCFLILFSLTPQNMQFIFSISSSDLSIKTKCYPSTIEIVEQNCGIYHVTKFWNVHLLNGDLNSSQYFL